MEVFMSPRCVDKVLGDTGGHEESRKSYVCVK